MGVNDGIVTALQRYIGRVVTLQSWGYQRYVGTVAYVNGEYVLLHNSLVYNEFDVGDWFDQQVSSDLADGNKVGADETMVWLSQISSVNCDDGTLPLLPDVNQLVAGAADASDSLVGIAEPVELRIGCGLISLAMNDNGLQQRIGDLRGEINARNGFGFPHVRLKDDLSYDCNEYRVLIGGVEVGGGEIYPDLFLAINPGKSKCELEGIHSEEPAFKLPAVWIERKLKRKAEITGYTVVDAMTVVTTHFGEIMQNHRHELLSYDAVDRSLRELAVNYPVLVGDHFASSSSKQILFRVLRELLLEKVWVGDLHKIATSVSVRISEKKSFPELLAAVRIDISRQLLHGYLNDQKELAVVVFEPSLELKVLDGSVLANPKELESFISETTQSIEELRLQGEKPVILVHGNKRKELAEKHCFAKLGAPFIAYEEVPSDCQINTHKIIYKTDVCTEPKM